MKDAANCADTLFREKKPNPFSHKTFFRIIIKVERQ